MRPPRQQEKPHQNSRHKTNNGKWNLPYRRGNPRLLPQPCQPSPKRRRGEGRTQCDGGAANRNHPHTFLPPLQLLRALPYPHLRRRHQSRSRRNRNRAQRLNRRPRVLRKLAAFRARFQVRAQPRLFLVGNFFWTRHGDQHPRTFMKICVHRRAPFNHGSSAFKPR